MRDSETSRSVNAAGSSVWRTILRRSLKVIAALAILVVVLFATIIGINLFDEKLSPTAVQLLQPPPNTVPEESNLYLALLGFHAPSGKDPIANAKAHVAEYDRSEETYLRGATRDPLVHEGPDALKFQGDLKEASPLTSSIWSFAKTHHAEIAESLRNNPELYARYRQWWRMTGYSETARPSIVTPFIFVEPDIRHLFLADLAVRLQSPTRATRQAALSDLKADLALWRVMLRAPGSIISKLVASIEIQGDALLLGDMVSDPKTELHDLDNTDVLQPFDLKDWHMGDAYLAEMRGRSSLWQLLETAPDFYSEKAPGGIRNRLSRLMFKANATTNREAELVRRQRDVVDADPARFLDLERSYREWAEGYLQWARARSLYNPVGRVLISIESTDLMNYSPRLYDVAALQRLVRLAYELREQGVAPDGVESYMKAHPEISTHPISGKFFNWNATTQLLTMPTVGKQKPDRRFGLTLTLKSHR